MALNGMVTGWIDEQSMAWFYSNAEIQLSSDHTIKRPPYKALGALFMSS
jgi:hypothetical protein